MMVKKRKFSKKQIEKDRALYPPKHTPKPPQQHTRTMGAFFGTLFGDFDQIKETEDKKEHDKLIMAGKRQCMH